MMELYGVFSPAISSIEQEWAVVRSVWTDPTAQTYDGFNENMELFTKEIWQRSEQAASGYKMVRDNYDKGEIDRTLYTLGSKVAAL